MTSDEKIQYLEQRLDAIEKSKGRRIWLAVGVVIVFPLGLWAATAIPNTFSDGDLLSAEKLNANFAALGDGIVPTGTIVAFAGQTAPEGWLLCDGTLTSRAQKSKLFVAIGTAYGAGDGSTTFHLPDLRGRFLRGVNGGAGRDPDTATRTAMNSGGNTGDAVGSLQGDMFKSHTHSANWAPGGGGGGGSAIDPLRNNILDTNATGGNETRPVNAYVNFIIKQ